MIQLWHILCTRNKFARCVKIAGDGGESYGMEDDHFFHDVSASIVGRRMHLADRQDSPGQYVADSTITASVKTKLVAEKVANLRNWLSKSVV